MPVRIYSFAKELGIENKDLLEVCEKLGLKGKGSALASLNDEEVSRVKSYLENNSQSETTAAPSKPEPEKPISPSRDDPANRRTSAIANLDEVKRRNEEHRRAEAARKAAEEAERAAEVAEAEAEKEAAAAEAAAEAAGNRADSVREESPGSPDRSAARSGNEPIRPSRDGFRYGRDLNKPRVLDGNRGEGRGGERDRPRKPDRKEPPKPAIRVAAMPQVEQPKARASSSGEKVQKPDISLPQDAIRRAKSGAAPLQQFTDSRKGGKEGGKGKFGGRADAAPGDILGEMPGRRKDAKERKKGKVVGQAGGDGVDFGMGSTRQARRPKRPAGDQGDDRRSRMRSNRRRSGPAVNTAAPRKDKIVLQLPTSVRSFSEATGVSSGELVKALMELGVMARINDNIDDELVDLLIDQFSLDVEIRAQESLEETLIAKLESHEDDPDSMTNRPPIVTFLGHVDHGKTSLLDAIIGINVVKGEAGGITQHIRAYEIDRNGQQISFVDTPGHEAFTEMRARGANVTDIAVLVVAADDGVMPQTEEAISHIKAAGVPIIVALNKIDLPNAQPDKALQDLAAHELLPSEWGGEVEVVRTSAIGGTGIDELLETILVTAELHEYKANPDRQAMGTCLEAEQESGRGVMAKVIVQTGTLKVGDVVVCGAAHGRVKAMYDTLRPKRKLKIAGPSVPVNLSGLDVAPEAGDRFHVVEDIADARTIAENRLDQTREQSLSGNTVRVSLEDFQDRLESGNLQVDRSNIVTLNLILRADVRGSIEAIQKELGKLDHPEIEIKILQALVGGITVADVRLAQASGAVIIGFNVVPEENARALAEDLQVEIRRYEIIYKVTDDIKATLEGRLKPEEKEVELGMAMVLRTFGVSKTGTIAGCRVMRGNIERNCRVRVIRDSRIIGDYELESLRREKDDAKTVQKGMECGMKLSGFNDVKEGDQLEAYKIEEIARTL